MRIILLLFMSLVVWMMVCCPGLWDSKRSFEAHRLYYDAPSEQTRRDLEEAKRLDRRDIMKFELVMIGILGVSAYSFIRAKTSGHKDLPA
jgi:hypothetical protein